MREKAFTSVINDAMTEFTTFYTSKVEEHLQEFVEDRLGKSEEDDLANEKKVYWVIEHFNKYLFDTYKEDLKSIIHKALLFTQNLLSF